jgi:hypothetical protein
MMKRHQFDEVVRTFWKRQPFRPFVIEYDDGTRFVIDEPSRFSCYAGAANFFHADDSIDIIDHEEVSRVYDLEEAKQAPA